MRFPCPRLDRVIVLVALLFARCRPDEPPPPTPSPGADNPVRLLVIDDPQLAEAIRRVWRAKSEAPLEVSQTPAEELPAGRLAADAVIYPSGLLGELAESNRLLPLSDDLQAAAPLNSREVLDMLRLREVRWGEQTYAVSFGSPVLLLAYRPEVLEQAGVSPPATWTEYQRLIAHLADRANLGGAALPESQPWFGTAEPWGPGWAGQTLLARAAAYVRHQDQYSDLFDYSTMAPLIDGPPFVRALEEMVAAAEHAPPQATSYSPQDAYRAVLEGRAAMALAWPSAHRPSEADDEAAAADADNGGSGPDVLWRVPPGSPDVYSFSADRWEQRDVDSPHFVPVLAAAGRLGSVTRETSRAQAALHVLAVLSAEWSREVAPHSPATTLYRESHLAAPGDWLPESADPQSAESYSQAAQKALTHGIWMFSPRIPGRARYLAALDEAARAALAGEASPADALSAAADQWRAITAELGEQKQIEAYQRSLGLEP
ncbi:MAG: extracellular solute-binding protein [Planctomycetes bacterium]|nr:extracellular solute-binding protein [Planctomycetota bacterium]